MSSFDKLTGSQKIRAAVHRDVRAISSETCHFLGLEVTKSAMEIIAELVYKKLTVYGADLEAFAKHAKRTVINSEDVKLLARRSPTLLAHLNTMVPSTNQTTNKRRKTVKPQETPVKTTETPAKTTDISTKNKENTNTNKRDSTNKEDSSITKEDNRKSTEQKEGTDKSSNVDFAIEDVFEDMIVDGTIDLTFD